MLDKIKTKLRQLLHGDAVLHDGHILPTKRPNEGLYDNDRYIQSAIDLANDVVKYCGRPTSETRLLDFGCGYGRLALGFEKIGVVCVYFGADINQKAIEWNWSFHSYHWAYWRFVDKKHRRYNPHGQEILSHWHGSCNDIVVAQSVLSHTNIEDLCGVLDDIKASMVPGGVGFITALVHPNGYSEKGNLWKVWYDEQMLLNTISRRFEVDKVVRKYQEKEDKILFIVRRK